MPNGRLNLYRFIEDAWSGGLRDWCLQATSEPSWILVENPGQTRWLLRKFSQDSLTGIQIFDPAALRDQFARLAALQPLPRHPATAAFAIKAAAHQQPGEPSISAARNATALAAASDTLARAGWHLNQLPIDPALARRIHRAMDSAALLPGIFERRLRQALPPQPVRLCCLGWDATHWPDLALLDLAAAKVRTFDLFIPSPRLPADSQQREWIESLEQRFALERLICPESPFTSENEPLVSRLENSQLASRAESCPPILLVGREWPDQVRAVCDQIKTWLATRDRKSGERQSSDSLNPIGIIAPDDSPTAIAVAETLETAGIQVEHPSRLREHPAPLLVLEHVARYHLTAHDIDQLIGLAKTLWLHFPQHWPALDPNLVHQALHRAFQSAQSRNARILARALPYRKDPTWSSLCTLVESLGRWETDLTLPALTEKWLALLSALHLPPDSLPTSSFNLHPSSFPSHAFMEWLAETLASERRLPPSTFIHQPSSFPSLAPVVVTTFANAAQQPWDHLIFLDSNEHIWPAPFVENPFLPDSLLLRLNQNRKDSPRLLTTRDLRALDQSRFLDLVEHCRSPIAFAGLLLDQTDPGGHVQPNDWVLRSLIETSSPDAESPSPLDQWLAAARAFPPEPPPPLDQSERAHMEIVHSSRKNPTMPFDRYQFNFNETKLEPGAWSATDLDQAITSPATFALRELFGAESMLSTTFTRAEGAAVGNRAHQWLGRILALRDHPSDDASLSREHTAARRELEQWYAADDLPLPIWWETCLRKTAWATRRCLREVRGSIDSNQHSTTEQKLAVTVRTPGGPLLLKGRLDILISDQPDLPGARVRIFDFKTGRSPAPTLATLANGYGAQFAAYYLMARDAGAAEVTIAIIKPEEPARDVFSAAAEQPLRDFFSAFAALSTNLRFGRRGPLTSDYGICESLPLATLPIDPAILDQKAALLLLAS